MIIPCTSANIKRAANLLKDGRLVAFPTETVYGLGADATNTQAVQAVFSAKNRPLTKPLPVHISDRTMAECLSLFDDRAHALADRFWPGALTLVLPLKHNTVLSPLLSANLKTIALRISAHPVAAALLTQAGRPLIMSSANQSGTRNNPTTATHVWQELGDQVDMILEDEEPSVTGIHSTILDLTGTKAVILRTGGISEQAISAALKEKVE